MGVARDRQTDNKSAVNQIDLLRVVAMELQQPLIHISGTAKMLRDGTIKPDETETQYENLAVSTERMQYLIESILLASKIESNQVELELNSINPSSVVHEVLTELKPLAKSYKVKLNVHFSQSLNLISTNNQALKYGLINLMDVAIRSTRSKQIDVLVHNQNDQVMVTIRDDSDKLPANTLNSLLRRIGKSAQPLKQLPINASLGLYIASILAGHTNSDIHFHSERGKRHISLNLPTSKQLSFL